MAPEHRCCYCSSRAIDTASMADEKKQAADNQKPNVRVSENKIIQLEKRAAKQCLPIEAATDTLIGAVTGAIHGVLLDFFKETAFSYQTPATLNPVKLARYGGYRPMVESFLLASRWDWGRNYAVMYGFYSGVSCVMKRLTGKEDVHSSMVAAFGSGVLVSMLNGVKGPEAMTIGVMAALLSGGQFKVQEMSSQPKPQDMLHDKTRDMFSGIGLGVDHYPIDLNTSITNNTLSFLNDSFCVGGQEIRKRRITCLTS